MLGIGKGEGHITVKGILNIATTLGQMAGPIVTGSLVTAGGYGLVFPTAIIFAVLACVFIMLIKKTK